MFFAPDMLSKRGPLAKVWLAAHVEKKVSKTQTLQTSIPSTVTVILDPGSTSTQSDGSAPPLALRLSGQLLLGITRIYGKQAKYLLEDCSEASDQIRAAFRAALTAKIGGSDRTGIDMLPEGGDPQNTINLRATRRNVFDFELEFGGDFDGFGDAWEADQFLDPASLRPAARTTANIADITLPEHDGMMHSGARYGDVDDAMDLDLGLGGSGGLQDFGDEAGLDLGLDFDFDQPTENNGGNQTTRGTKRRATDNDDEEGLADQTIDSEVGRDAPGIFDRRSARDSLALDQSDLHLSDKMDGHPGSVVDGDITMDLDTGFENTGFAGQGFDTGPFGLEGDRTPQANRSRQCTPTPHPRAENQNPLLGSIEVTPRTSHRLAQLQSPVRPTGGGDALPSEGAAKKPPTKKAKTQLVDAVTELEGNGIGRVGGMGSQGGSQNMGATTSRADKIAAGLYLEPNYLPKNRYELACLEIRLNPRRNRHLPKTVTEGGSQWLLAAPPGICAELTNLFKFPAPAANAPTRGRSSRLLEGGPAGGDVEQGQMTRSRSIDSELGRRREAGLEEVSGFGEGPSNITFDGVEDEPTGMMMGLEDGQIFQEEFRFEMQSNPDQPLDDAQSNPRRSPTAAVEELPRLARADGESSLLDLFDELSESQPTQSSIKENATQDGAKGPTTKWSKNTVKALKVLKGQFIDHDEDDLHEQGGNKKISFEKVSEKATKRAASSFFFELLVLTTRDCLKLEQNRPYGPIEVEKQDRLWEVMEQEAI
ncbi:Rec8 like protein-domain-containing protein [Melampsora americana]|nr:Rec8 like protein-domain-containing protein [Melampsora americana]